MYNSLKISICILCVIFLSACGIDDVMKYKLSNVQFDTDEYKIEGEKISFIGDTDGIKKLNEDYENQFDEWMNDFTKRVDLDSADTIEKPCMQARHQVRYNKNSLVSIVTQKYTFISGAHGNTWQCSRNFSLTEDKQLLLSDLFVDDKYTQILNQRLSEIVAENEDEFHDLWEEPVIGKNSENNFYFNENGDLVIYYEPYELSYYAKGVVEFPIKTELIRGYIKQEYLN